MKRKAKSLEVKLDILEKQLEGLCGWSGGREMSWTELIVCSTPLIHVKL